MDIARGEATEKELDAMIRRRHDQRVRDEGQQRIEDLWQESVRRYNARCGEEERLERLHYHEGQIRRLSVTLEALIARHEAEAQKYRAYGHENGHKRGAA